MHRVSTIKVTDKDWNAAIRLIDTLIQGERLIIDPRCVQLKAQLLKVKKTKKAKKANDFDHSEEHSHFDLVAALMYLVKDFSFGTNPYPPDFDVITGRALPAHHPFMARRKIHNAGKANGLASALLASNPYVQRGYGKPR